MKLTASDFIRLSWPLDDVTEDAVMQSVVCLPVRAPATLNIKGGWKTHAQTRMLEILTLTLKNDQMASTPEQSTCSAPKIIARHALCQAPPIEAYATLITLTPLTPPIDVLYPNFSSSSVAHRPSIPTSINLSSSLGACWCVTQSPPG